MIQEDCLRYRAWSKKKHHREFSKSAPELPRSKVFLSNESLIIPASCDKKILSADNFFPTSQIKKSPFSEDYPEWKKYKNEKMVLFGCF